MKTAMPIKLALVMIVKNEAVYIERCLASVSGIVDEMIVLDTGSSDDTVAVARRLGASVHHFKWIDDFAAARNAALDLSTADWNLVLDADEWVVSGLDALRGLAGDLFVGQVAVASVFDQAGAGSESIEWISRLLPRGVRYTGRIHEQPDSPWLPRRRMEVHIAHDGYLPERLAVKQGRNEFLLKKALLEKPNDAYLLYQLGKELSVYGRYGESTDYFLNALDLSLPDDSFRHDLVVRTMFALKKAGLLEQAIELASREFEHWQHSPDYFFCVADVFLDWAMQNPDQAEKSFLPIAESSWLKCLELGEQPMLSGSVAGRGSFLAAHNLAVLYENTGHPQKAEHYTDLAGKLRTKPSR